MTHSRHEFIDYDKEEELKREDERKDKRTPSLKRFKNDPYLSSLLQLVNQLEIIYGLNSEQERTDNEIRPLSDLEIVQLNTIVKRSLEKQNDKERRATNIKASGVMGSVLYLDYLLKFNQEYRIKFNDHPGIGALVGLLSKFKTLETCKEYKRTYMNAVIKSLQMYEQSSLMRINTKLSYKLLRMFYVLVMYDNISDASIVANMLLYQVRYAIKSKVSFDGVETAIDIQEDVNPSPTETQDVNTNRTQPRRRARRVPPKQ